MNILVCVKQVPDTTEIKIDPVKNTLIREGVPSIVNPFDGYALEAAGEGPADFLWADSAGLETRAVPSAFARYYDEALRLLEEER